MANNLKYELALDTAQFTKGVDRAEKSVSGLMAAAASGAGAAAGMGIMTAATAALGKAADIASGALSHLFQFGREALTAAASIEMADARLQNYTKTAGEAAEATRRINEFAQTPPFGLKEAEAAAKALLATGTPVKALTQEMNVLGNVAAAAGTSLESMAQKYTFAHEQGSISMRELRELAMGGIPIFETLAKVVGKTPGELKKALSEGRVTFGNFQAALNELGGTGKQFGQAMDKLGATFDGKLKTLEGRWEAFKATLGKPFIEAVTPWLDVVGNRVKWITELTGKGMEVLKSTLADGNFSLLLSEGIKWAFKEAGNYGIATFEYLAKVFAIGLEESMTVMERLTGGDLSSSFLKVLESGGVVLKNGFLLALGEFSKGMLLIAPKFLGYLNAGLDKSVEKVLGVFGSSYKAESADYYARQNTRDFGIEELVTVVNDEAKRLKTGISNAMEEAKKPIGNLGSALIDEVVPAIAGGIRKVPFKKEDFFGAEIHKEASKQIARDSNPEAYEEFMKAWERGASGMDETTNALDKLSGASKSLAPNLKAEEEARKKAAKAMEELAKRTKETEIVMARANGQYRRAAQLDYQKRFDDMIRDYVDNKGLTSAQARIRANDDLMNEARSARRMDRPGEQARADSAARRVRDQIASQGILGMGALPGTPLSQLATLGRRRNEDLLPAAAKKENQDKNWMGNIAQILTYIEQIAGDFSKLELAT